MWRSPSGRPSDGWPESRPHHAPYADAYWNSGGGNRFPGYSAPPDSDAVQVATALSEEELMMNAGRDAMDHALNAAAATLDSTAFEQLHAAIRYAGRAYFTSSPWAMFSDLVRLRDTLYELLDRTRKPSQQSELYLLAGLACAHLSSVCFELARPDVAEKHIRAAHTYGSLIDHPSLCAWARQVQVSVSIKLNWQYRLAHLLLLLETVSRQRSNAPLRYNGTMTYPKVTGG